MNVYIYICTCLHELSFADSAAYSVTLSPPLWCILEMFNELKVIDYSHELTRQHSSC